MEEQNSRPNEKSFETAIDSTNWIAGSINEKETILSPPFQEENPKVAVKTGEDEWWDKTAFVEKLENGKVKIDSVEGKKYFHYSSGGEVEQLVLFYLYTDLKENGKTIYLMLEAPETYIDKNPPPWGKLVHKKMNIPEVYYKDKKTSFYLDGHFISKASPATAKRVAGLEDKKERLKNFLNSSIEESWGLSEERGIILEGHRVQEKPN